MVNKVTNTYTLQDWNVLMDTVYGAVTKVSLIRNSTQYYFVFQVPYEEVPLYINDKSLEPYVTWRLKIGK